MMAANTRCSNTKKWLKNLHINGESVVLFYSHICNTYLLAFCHRAVEHYGCIANKSHELIRKDYWDMVS